MWKDVLTSLIFYYFRHFSWSGREIMTQISKEFRNFTKNTKWKTFLWIKPMFIKSNISSLVSGTRLLLLTFSTTFSTVVLGFYLFPYSNLWRLSFHRSNRHYWLSFPQLNGFGHQWRIHRQTVNGAAIFSILNSHLSAQKRTSCIILSSRERKI